MAGVVASSGTRHNLAIMDQRALSWSGARACQIAISDLYRAPLVIQTQSSFLSAKFSSLSMTVYEVGQCLRIKFTEILISAHAERHLCNA